MKPLRKPGGGGKVLSEHRKTSYAFFCMQRVMVIGNAAGGKSTLCRALAARHALPCYSIDKILWQPNWVRTPEPEFTRAHEEILAGHRWLIDGYGPWVSIERRLSVADTIIFVDHPIWRHYWWATKRQIGSLFGGRADGPEGCPLLPVTLRLYTMMWQLHRKMRPQLLQAIEQHRPHTRIIHIRSPADLARLASNPD
jgi:adenylate kinase family enzyme